MSDQNTSRRRLLAAGAALTTASFSGCVDFLKRDVGGSDGGGDGSNLLSDGRDTIVATHPDVSAAVNSVKHTPSEPSTTVEGVIEVPEEKEYEVRLGVLDEDDVVLAYEEWNELLYTSGRNRVVREFSIDECGRCYSGIVEVDITDEEKERRQEEQEQAAEERREQKQAGDGQQTDKETSTSENETETEDDNETENGGSD